MKGEKKRVMGIRNKRLYVRVTEEEKKEILKKAREANMNLSEYVIKMSTNGVIYVINELPEMNHQLRKIGTNLNQLTHLSHIGKIKCPDLGPMKDEVRKVLQSLNSLIVKTRKLKV